MTFDFQKVSINILNCLSVVRCLLTVVPLKAKLLAVREDGAEKARKAGKRWDAGVKERPKEAPLTT